MNNTKDVNKNEEDDNGDASSLSGDDSDGMSSASSGHKIEEVPAAVTVDLVNQALQMPDGQQLQPEILQRILGVHAAAAKAHDAAQAKAAADAEAAANSEALKRQQEEYEDARDVAELNGDTSRPPPPGEAKHVRPHRAPLEHPSCLGQQAQQLHPW